MTPRVRRASHGNRIITPDEMAADLVASMNQAMAAMPEDQRAEFAAAVVDWFCAMNGFPQEVRYAP